MWSDRYNYYNIQSDEHFSQTIETSKLVEILLSTNCFKQSNHQTFTNAEGFPWVDLIITETPDGNYAAQEEPLEYINLIAIVCSKGLHVDQQIYIEDFLDIAERLGWKLFLEQDDDENEDVEIRRQ